MENINCFYDAQQEIVTLNDKIFIWLNMINATACLTDKIILKRFITKAKRRITKLRKDAFKKYFN